MAMRVLAAWVSMLLCCAQAAAQDAVSMAYDPKTVDVLPVTLSGACAVTVTEISDQRNNKETVGTDFRPLVSPDPLPWVGAALANLSAYGYTVARADKSKASDVAISAALTRSYTFLGPMRINGVVALDARLTTPSGRQIARKYRASGSKTNMMGAVDEYMTTLNYAMNNLLAQLAADLQEICAGK